MGHQSTVFSSKISKPLFHENLNLPRRIIRAVRFPCVVSAAHGDRIDPASHDFCTRLVSHMNNATNSEVPEAIQLLLDGRVFPATAPASGTLTHPRIRQLRTTAADENLPSRIFDSLWPQLPWATETSEVDSRERTARLYAESLRQIRLYEESCDQLIRRVCEANVEFRSGDDMHSWDSQRAASLARHDTLQSMYRETATEWPPLKPISDADLMSQGQSVYVPLLEQSVKDETRRFVDHLFFGLSNLVDRQHCGLVEWFPNHCCRYHFFRQVICPLPHYLADAGDADLSDDDDDDADRSGNESSGVRYDVFPHDVVLARHEHELIQAIRTSPGNSRVVIPQKVRAVIDAIPAWLYPFVEIIDGTLVRERIVERQQKSLEYRTVHEEPTADPDPGLILGPFLLCGWGPKEITVEQDRQKELTTESTPSPLHAQLTAMKTLTAILLFLLMVFLLSSRKSSTSVLLLFALSVATTAGVWHTVWTKRRLDSPEASSLENGAFASAAASAFLTAECAFFALTSGAWWPVKFLTLVTLCTGTAGIALKFTKTRVL